MHVPMTQVVAPGKLVVYEDNKEKPFVAALHSGTVKIMPDVVTILAEVCELKGEIDIERAKASRKRAIERIEKKSDENYNPKRAELSLKRAETRIAVESM